MGELLTVLLLVAAIGLAVWAYMRLVWGLLQVLRRRAARLRAWWREQV